MSLQELNNVFQNLTSIKDYLSKIGPVRRQSSDTAKNKFNEAQKLYSRLEYISSDIKLQIENSEISCDSLPLVNKCIDNIHILYKKILSLYCVEEKIETKMATTSNFELKTALALLPIMTAQETVITQLIDSILLYSDMLNDEGKNQLINFVLKTRISSSAKLRLKSSYSNVDDLVKDMRTHLLQKKSAIAIQSQMYRASQGRRSIDKFGSELEQLFVNLTIAQADGDDKKYDVLHPINEKIAIKRFADGLSDSRLSTIIASRQFKSLPEAIQTALDESTLSSPNVEQVMNVRSYRGRGTANRFGFRRGPMPNKNTNNWGNNYQPSQLPPRISHNNKTFYNAYRSGPPRGIGRERYQRGTPRTQHGSSRSNMNVAVAQLQREQTDSSERTQFAPDSEFFRSFNK